MLTRYRFMRETIGLSQAEAADRVHGGARLDTVKGWDSGRRPPPIGVMVELHELSRRLDQAAQDLSREIEARWQVTGPIAVPVAVPATPEDAYGQGFPSHQAMMRTIGAAVSRLPPAIAVEFVQLAEAAAVTATLPDYARAN